MLCAPVMQKGDLCFIYALEFVALKAASTKFPNDIVQLEKALFQIIA